MFYTVHRQRESISGTASSSLHLLTFILAFVGLAANPGATLAATSSANEVVIQVKAGSANSDHAAIQVDLPGSFSATTIRAVLNGKDISARLIPSVCAQDPCVTGTVSESDGLRVGKNVVYVTARTSEGKLATGRMRFFQGEAQRAASDGTKTVTNSLRAQATDASGSSSYLTPMETFQTVYAGGWDSNRPWFQVGLGGYYPASGEPACAAGSIYLALVFDRQALTPVGSKGCYSSGSTLAAFLKTLSSGDLVVVGTVSNASSDAELDTSAIGGTDHAKDKNIPTGYVAIGVGGATPGTAYENFAVQTNGDDTLATPMWPFATGVVQEDSDGNYNFESSDVLEYWVDPFSTDPEADHPGMLTIAPSLAATLANPSLKGYRFLPPAAGSSHGGYWLVVLQRDSPWVAIKPTTSCTAGAVGSDGLQRFPNCGTVYDTGDPDNAKAAYASLANDLNAIGPYDLAFLTAYSAASSGYPVCCGDPWNITGNVNWYSDNGATNGYSSFRNALEALGGSGRATLFWDFNAGQYNPTAAYSYVFSSNTGDPLTGNSAVSASAYAAAGQTGYIHGLLARNLNGLFQPFQTSQQQDSAADIQSGPDYLLTKLSTLPPVPWPELSGALLGGASTIAGQEAAYHYASFMLLTNYYIKGVSGNYLDDIHYFFTGSNANYINYHYFDPANLPAPAFSSGQYCWSGPGDNPYPTQVCFAQSDFNAVTAQLSSEVVDLTNVMNFMVSGPVNLKNLIATGNSNAGLALTGAAASILASGLTPTQTTTTLEVNTSNVLTMLGGIVSLGAGIASDGTITGLAPSLFKGVNFWGSALGSTLGGVAGAVGGLHKPGSTTTGIPSRFISFTTTVGDLANSSLQDQLGISFDTTLDSFLGDWGKLSTLGPKITDTSDPTYYSPNQVAQGAAIKVLAQASQRSFYMSLLPNFYGIYYFPDFAGINPADNLNCGGTCPDNGNLSNQPDMGSAQVNAGTSNCEPFFMAGSNSYPGLTNTAPVDSFVWMPSPSHNVQLGSLPWDNPRRDDGWTPSTISPSDFYVIAATSAQFPGTNKTFVNFMSGSLSQQLFSSAGLDLPVDLFVDQQGPLQSTFFNQRTISATDSPLGYSAPSTCKSRPYYVNGRGSTVGSPEPPPPPSPPSTATTTTLTLPTSAVLGEDVPMSVQVIAGSSPVTVGSVFLAQDGAQIAQLTPDANGKVSFTASSGSLSLGAHTFQALYAAGDGYASSSSSVITLTVFANAPALSLTLSTSTLNVSYRATSPAVAVQIASQYGAAGAVTLSCSGLPIGMTCNFAPAQATIAAGGSASATLTIGSTANSASAVSPNGSGKSAAIALSVPLIALLGVCRGHRRVAQMLGLGMLAIILSSLTACGGSPSTKPTQETGTKTVLVNATSGSITQSTPLILNIQ